MKSLYRGNYLWLLTLALLFIFSQITKAQSPRIIKIISQGEKTPLGGTFNLQSAISNLSFNDNEDVTFACQIDSAQKPTAVFATQGSKIIPIVAEGDSIAGYEKVGPGLTASYVSINNQGSVAFGDQIISGGQTKPRIFISTAQGITRIVQHGDPMSGGGVIESPKLQTFSLNNSGAAAFEVNLTNPGPPFRQAILIYNNGTILKAVATDDPTPIGGTFSFAFLHMLGFNDQGTVLFHDQVTFTIDSTSEGIFTSSSSGILKIAARGDPAPDGSKLYYYFSNFGSINNQGDVAFTATVGDKDGNNFYDALFLYSGGTITQVTKVNDPAPGGGTFQGFFGLSINDSKQIAFSASGDFGSGFFIASNGAIEKIVKQGEASPQGDAFSNMSILPGFNSSGTAAFVAGTGTGTLTWGIFLWNAGPRISLSREKVEFTDIIPGQTARQEMEILNSGGKPLTVQEISAAPNPPFGLENVPALPLSIEPGQKAQFLVTYQAPANSRASISKTSAILVDGSLTISTNARGGPKVIPLSVPATSPLRVEFVPNEIKAGETATIEIKVVDINNNIDKAFSGGATITLLEDQSTPGITRLEAQQSVLISEGAAQPVFFFTPKDPFAPEKPIGDLTVLSGKAVIKVELENSNIPAVTKEIMVKSPLDFFVDSIQIQQGVLNSDKDVFEEYLPGVGRTFPALPFIAEHSAAVQVFVRYKNTVPFVSFSKVELKGFSAVFKILLDGNPIRTIDKMSSGAFATRDFILKDVYEPAEQENLTDALNAFFDNSSLASPGSYTFDAELKLKEGIEEAEADKANNRKSYQAQFTATRPLRVLAAVGVMAGKTPEKITDDMFSALKDVFPIQNSKLIANDPNNRIYYFSGGVLGSSFFSDVNFGTLTKILARFNKENPSDQRDLLMMYSPLELAQEICSNKFTRGCAEYVGGKVAILTFNDPLGTAHEIGHLMGLKDTYKTDQYKTRDGEPNPRRSNATNSGNPVENGNINLTDHEKNVVPGIPHTEFMGSARGWTDRVSWDHLYRTKFQNPPASALAKNSSTSETGFIVISGTIDTNSTVVFNPFLTLPQVPGVAEPQDTGRYSLEFQNSSGSVLNTHHFTVDFILPDAGEQAKVPFSFYLPLAEGTAKMVMKKDGIDIGDRIFSVNAPSVELIFPQSGSSITGELPVEWSASDPDGDRITYDVLYCPNGKDQIVLAVNLDSTSFIWNTSFYPSSASGSITVIANDGINEARAIVDNLAVETPVVGVKEKKALPKAYSLSQNYPNPFNPSTTIRFDLPGPSDVTLIIYNIQGQEVKKLTNGTFTAGEHTVTWEGRDNNGRKVSSGTYIIQMRAGEFLSTRKLVILK